MSRAKKIVGILALIFVLAGCGSSSYTFTPEVAPQDSHSVESCGTVILKEVGFWSTKRTSIGRFCPVSDNR